MNVDAREERHPISSPVKSHTTTLLVLAAVLAASAAKSIGSWHMAKLVGPSCLTRSSWDSSSLSSSLLSRIMALSASFLRSNAKVQRTPQRDSEKSV